VRGLTREERAFLTLPSGSNLDGYGHMIQPLVQRGLLREAAIPLWWERTPECWLALRLDAAARAIGVAA
jgi:hypothetical protein